MGQDEETNLPGKEKTLEEKILEQQERWNRAQAGKGKVKLTREQAIAAIEYEERLRKEERLGSSLNIQDLMESAERKVRPLRLPQPYPVPLADCEKLFYYFYQKLVEAEGKVFFMEEENRPKVTELVKYFCGHPSALNPHRGVCLLGAVGRGKSWIMKALMQMCGHIEERLEQQIQEYHLVPRSFKFARASMIVDKVAEAKNIGLLNQYYNGVWCFDDIGEKNEQANIWGAKVNVIEKLIINRAERFQNRGLITHATTNTKPSDWEALYGSRAHSRMTGMFNVITLLGVDKRPLTDGQPKKENE